MTNKSLEAMSREELLRELQNLELQARSAKAGARDAESVLHNLNVHQVELEMQNRELREAQSRLEESRAQYADLYDLAPVGYCTLDLAGNILGMNLAGAALLGAPRGALTGKPFAAVAHLEDSQSFAVHLRRCGEEKRRVASELTLSAPGHRSRVVRILSDPVGSDGGAAVAYRTILIDISDLKELEDKLRLLSVAGQQLGALLDYESVLEAAAGLTVPALADLCMVDVPAASGRPGRRVVLFADSRKQATLGGRLKELTVPRGWQSPQSRVIESREPMLLSEVSDELRARLAYDDVQADALLAAGIRSLMVVPLVTGGRALGALTLAAAESERRYTSSDLRLAQDLANRVAMALENANLYAEARRANRELRLAEAKSSGILSISADAIISLDETRRITLFNEGATRIYGYERAEALGAPFEMLIPERLRAAHRSHIEEFAAGKGFARRMDERGLAVAGLRKNGEEFPADATISKLEAGGEVILTLAVRDVSAQKRIEHEQRFLAEVGLALATTLDYDETLSRIVDLAVHELADVVLVDIVGDDGVLGRERVVSNDPSKVATCDALVAIPLRRTPHFTSTAIETKRPTVMERVSPEMVTAFAQGEEDLRLLRELDPRSAIAVPLVVHGKLLGAIALVSTTPSRSYGQADVPLAEELARRAALSIDNAELYRRAMSAIRARDDILGVVAHDLRNPLGIILTQAHLLKSAAHEPERRSRKPAEVITRAATRMNRLIEDLLDVTRMEGAPLALEQALVEAERVIEDSLDAQSTLATSASVELRADVAPDLPRIWADRERVLQVLENLIGNALKSMAHGGEVTVGAAPREGEVLFWVRDTGVGIPAEEVPHVFDRFWQARKLHRSGAGLGLAIVKGIVESHGGSVWIESRPGAGTTAFFTLPTAPHSTRRVILVAEDDPDYRESLDGMLKPAGYDVVMVANGEEALSYLRHAPAPFLILVDLTMPVMDGWAFLAEKNRDPALRSIPAIVLSGQRDVGARVASAHASYVSKAISPENLLETIERVVH